MLSLRSDKTKISDLKRSILSNQNVGWLYVQVTLDCRAPNGVFQCPSRIECHFTDLFHMSGATVLNEMVSQVDALPVIGAIFFHKDKHLPEISSTTFAREMKG